MASRVLLKGLPPASTSSAGRAWPRRGWAVASWIICGAIACAIIARPLAAIWVVHERQASPVERRSLAVVMDARASDAVKIARGAIADLAVVRPAAVAQAAAARLRSARLDFSRDMAKAAQASTAHQAELLALKSRGETLLDQNCAPWTALDSSHQPQARTPRSQLSYFEQCSSQIASLQTALDAEDQILIDEMIKADGNGSELGGPQGAAGPRKPPGAPHIPT